VSAHPAFSAPVIPTLARRRRKLLSPEILALVEALDATPRDAPPSVAELRDEHERGAPELSGPAPAIARISDLAIAGPHGEIPLRAYAPATAGGLPVVVYLHGGGWTVGSIASYDGMGRALARAAGAVVVSVGYRLAPEHPFPTAIDEAVAALRWAGEHGAAIGGDPARLAVAGDSSGATLATVAARRLRDAGGPALRMQALVYPPADAALDTRSARDFATGFGFSADAMRRYWELYLDGHDPGDPDASPLHARDLSGLPPAFVATAAADVLRDEGEAYAARLRAAGVRVAARRYPGTVHGFWRWLRTRAARQAVGEVGAALRASLA
jgi:acetyl esterase